MDDTLVNLLAVVVLLAANAFFVAAEFALVKVRGVRVESLATDGSASARLTVLMLGQLEPHLAACQLGITMASLGLGWVGEPAVAALIEPMLASAGMVEHVHTISFAVGFLIFSSLHIVIGEQVPKTLAIRKPEPVSLAIAYPLRGFYLLCYPLNWTLNRASNLVLSLLGVRSVGHEEALTGAELSSLADTAHTHGSIQEHQASMVRNVFQFDERPVSRVMAPRREVDILDLANSAEENIKLVRETQHSRLPVIDGDWDNVLGVVLLKDLLELLLSDEPDPWSSLRGIVRAPLVVPESQRVARLFETMRTERAHMAFVLDEYGEFVGLVTLEDLLEEIVGDIEDEFDQPGEAISLRVTDDGWIAHGLFPLSDLERATGLRVDLDLDANTLSGLVMRRLERLPEPGDVIEEDGFEITVQSVKSRRVELAVIRELNAAGNPAAPDKPTPAAD